MTTKRPNSAEAAYQRIRSAVASGEYPPGTRVKEEPLAEAIGVSRTPIREALRRLHSEGVVRMIPNRGAYVMSFSDQAIEEVFALRAEVEGFCASLAALKASDDQIRVLADLSTEMEMTARLRRKGWLETVVTLDRKFHQGVLESTANEPLVSAVTMLREMPVVLKSFETYSAEQLERSLRHHRELLEALREGNQGWAAATMQAHIMAARQILYRPDEE